MGFSPGEKQKVLARLKALDDKVQVLEFKLEGLLSAKVAAKPAKKKAKKG